MSISETTSDPPSQSDLGGRQLGDYRLLRRLGRGAMADVYLAEQCSLRRQVALKVLKPHLAVDELYVKRFHNEAQAAAALVHANIVQIHEVGCLEGIHFIAQEYVAGQNLREFLARRGPPELRQALAILRQVAAALNKAAEQGIVHRDIKPENIMLAKTGEVKVADFGLARLSGDAAALNLTQVGITMGTPLYMSPEQVEGRQLDPRSDIYSLGITSYHMLAGQPPFRGDTALAVAVQHLHSAPERLEILRPDLPTALCRVVHKMLAKNPEERYPGARELLRELRGLQIAGGDDALHEGGDADDWDDADLVASTHGRSEATQQLDALMKSESPAARNRRWLLLAAAGAIVAFALGGAGAIATRERSLLTTDAAAVSQRANAKDQLSYAAILDSEEGYKSVGRYFPEDKARVMQSKQQLARWYLQNERYADAMKLFDEFAKQSDVDIQYRAFGLAGQAIVLSVEKKYDQSADKMLQLRELAEPPAPAAGAKPARPPILISQLLDPDFARMARRAFESDEAALAKHNAQRDQTWVQKHFGEE